MAGASRQLQLAKLGACKQVFFWYEIKNVNNFVNKLLNAKGGPNFEVLHKSLPFECLTQKEMAQIFACELEMRETARFAQKCLLSWLVYSKWNPIIAQILKD